jgi:hypothetical protein
LPQKRSENRLRKQGNFQTNSQVRSNKNKRINQNIFHVSAQEII